MKLLRRPRSKTAPRPGKLVLAFRWGLPAAFIIFGIVMLILSHGHLTGVQDQASGGNVFSGATFTNHDSLLSAIGVASFVMAAMVVLLDWLLRLNADESGERADEENAREHFRRTGHWPGE